MTDNTFMRTPLTNEQSKDIWKCIYRWEAIRRENGYRSTPTLIDVSKSCLLGRMLLEGKPPLDIPPPTAHAAPWYKLIEDGYAVFSSKFNFLYGPMPAEKYSDYHGNNRFVMNICGCLWGAEYEGEFSYQVFHDGAPGKWILRNLRPEDGQFEGGLERQMDGSFKPFFLNENDWILKRIED
jgi:hypothetical protein